MTGLLIFALAASAVMTIAYAVWSVAQRGTTFSRFNRSTLLAIVAASIAGGLMYTCDTGSHTASVIFGRIEALGIAAAPDGDLSAAATAHHPMPWRGAILAVYISGMAAVGLWHIANLCAMAWIIGRSRRHRMGRCTLAVNPRRSPGPFSWGRWIVVPRHMADGADTLALRMIVCHEGAHLSRLHWADLLLMGAVKTVMWFNPSAWLLTADLSDLHEFEADAAVTARFDPATYQILLIKTTAGSRLQAMADSLNHSSLKKRITMMMKNPTKSRARWRALAMVPAVAMALTVINVPAVASTLRSLEPAVTAPAADKVAATPDKGTQKSPETQTPEAGLPDKLPEYIGGDRKMYEDLHDIMTAFDAPEGTPDGRTVVRIVVSPEGEVTEPSIVKSGGEALDRFVLENITRLGRFNPGMTDGKPVPVSFTIPVQYKQK